jgi:hypothetical protein
MKTSKKVKKILPEVHILGDLENVKNLVAGVNKKKTIVVFRDGEQGNLYLEVEGEIQQILQDDITELEKEYYLIFFSFFPSLKKPEPIIEENTETDVQEKDRKKDKKKKHENKIKKTTKKKKKDQ